MQNREQNPGLADGGMRLIRRVLLPLFALGAIFGPIGDLVHVLTRTDGYPAGAGLRVFGLLPLWVPPLFGAATMGIGLGYALALRLRPSLWGSAAPVSASRVAAAMTAFLALYALSGALPWEAGGATDPILAAGALAVWFAADRTPAGLALAALAAAVSVVAEILLTRAGAFFYLPRVANFHGVPSWLFWLYVAAVPGVGAFTRWRLSPEANASAGRPEGADARGTRTVRRPRCN